MSRIPSKGGGKTAQTILACSAGETEWHMCNGNGVDFADGMDDASVVLHLLGCQSHVGHVEAEECHHHVWFMAEAVRHVGQIQQTAHWTTVFVVVVVVKVFVAVVESCSWKLGNRQCFPPPANRIQHCRKVGGPQTTTDRAIGTSFGGYQGSGAYVEIGRLVAHALDGGLEEVSIREELGRDVLVSQERRNLAQNLDNEAPIL